jgi:hypothetical protein
MKHNLSTGTTQSAASGLTKPAKAIVLGKFMTDLTLRQQSFVKDDVPTRLHHLAANLSQIQSLWI